MAATPPTVVPGSTSSVFPSGSVTRGMRIVSRLDRAAPSLHVVRRAPHTKSPPRVQAQRRSRASFKFRVSSRVRFADAEGGRGGPSLRSKGWVHDDWIVVGLRSHLAF